MGNAEPPRSALYLLRPHGFGGQLIKNVMEIGAVEGLEPPSAPCHRSEYIE